MKKARMIKYVLTETVLITLIAVTVFMMLVINI